ncbi:MAG: hypothetical protein MK085_07005 [Phycisphaerales bacterium]|nr:hypothetical protein [Phycisphaerales bacterium]
MNSTLSKPHRLLVTFLALMLPVCCCSLRITAGVLDAESVATSMQSCCGGGCSEQPSDDAPAPDCGDSGCGCCLKAPNTGQTTIDLSELSVLNDLHPVAERCHDVDHVPGFRHVANGYDTRSLAGEHPESAARKLRSTITLQV